MIVPEPKLILVDTPLKSEPPKPLGDLRQVRVDEYFRSMELSANSIRAYKRALTRFTKWTDSGATPRRRQDVAYKLRGKPTETATPQGNAHQANR